MHNYYHDILEKLGEPLWWDENAVPRYCEFSPNEISNIYAHEAILLKIGCQNCGTSFRVVISNSGYNPHNYTEYSFEDNLRFLHYGDPPNYHCCSAGPSMNCNDNRILEFWRKADKYPWEWVRIPENEIFLGDDVPF